MKNKRRKSKQKQFNLRLEIDRFFDKMRYKNDIKEYPGTEYSYQNVDELVNKLLDKYNEDYVITREPKRNFIFKDEIRNEGFKILFSFKNENKFNYFKDTLFSSFKDHLFIKIKRSNLTDRFSGQVLLTKLKTKVGDTQQVTNTKEVKWSNMK